VHNRDMKRTQAGDSKNTLKTARAC